MTMPFIPAANCARVDLVYSIGGVTCMNVFHVRKGSPFSLADLQALRGVVDTWDNATWKTARATACTLVRIKTKALDAEDSPFEDYFLPTPRAGTRASGALSNNVTFCIKLASNQIGRSARGRWYCVGLSSDSVASPTTMNTTVANAFVGYLQTLKTNLAAAGYTMTIVSYRHDKAWRAAAATYDVANIVAVDYNIDSMRRRLAGRGI